MGRRSALVKGKGGAGPKGKKARAKAKLERRWGEAVNEEEVQRARVRRGRSRLLPPAAKGGGVGRLSEKVFSGGGEEVAVVPPRENGTQSSVDDSCSSSDEDLRHRRDRGYDGEDDEVGENANTLNMLLDKIGAQTRKVPGILYEGTVGREASEMGEDYDSESSEEMGTAEENESESGDDGYMSADEDHDDSTSADEGGEDRQMSLGDSRLELFNTDDPHSENNGEDASSVTGSKNDANDPYASHFGRDPLPDNSEHALTEALKPSQKIRRVPTHIDSSLELYLSGPVLDELSSSGYPLKAEDDAQISILRSRWWALAAASYHHSRKVLVQNWGAYNEQVLRNYAETGARLGKKKKKKNGGKTRDGLFSELQNVIYPSLARYADVFITSENQENREDTSNVVTLHVLNHVLTARSRVQKHNRRIKELTAEEGGNNDVKTGPGRDVTEDDEDRWRDQGFTRPKVLILLPTRGTCLTFVQRLVALLGDTAAVGNLDRFEAEYGTPAVDGVVEDDEEQIKRRKSVLEAKGAAWQELFGDTVNDDDDFKIGIAVTPNAAVRKSKKAKSKKTGTEAMGGGVSVRLYSEFYRSDIIIASPLGLKMAIAGGGEEDDAEEDVDVDFLSSIEICMVAHADVLLMQNWDHVNTILDAINRQPKKNNDTDFSRVRKYLLTGQALYWRQLVVVSSLSDPSIISSFKRHAKSVGGRLKLCRRVPGEQASICNVLLRVKQVFQRVHCASFSDQGADRLRYFADRVLPQLERLQQKHTLVYIPSYFDFVSVRNLLLKREASFVSVTEYARVSEVSRGRARFVQGRKSLMLYTGRAHFFQRHKITGARHLIFFGLPEHCEFYPELVNGLRNDGGGRHVSDGGRGEGDDMEVDSPPSCLALFTKYDAHSLERIVGRGNCERMVKGEKKTYLFSS